MPPGSWSRAGALEDEQRWRELASSVDGDLPALQAAGRQMRVELADRDLRTTLRAFVALAEGSHALARFVQADMEAVRVLESAGSPVPDGAVVLFPAIAGAVRATRDADGAWTLDGLQPRTVHPGAVPWALVVAQTDEGDRLFLFAMNAPGVVPDRVPLRVVAPKSPNGPVAFSSVPAEPVGTARWWAGWVEPWDGMLRDAACWLGSSMWLCRAIEATLAVRTDAADLVRVGRVDVWVFSARMAVRDAVLVVEPDPLSPVAELAARRAAAVTATTVDTVVRLVALLSDPRVSKEDSRLPDRVAQLQIALQRFDAQANLRAIGLIVAATTSSRDDEG